MELHRLSPSTGMRVDLTNQDAVMAFFRENKFKYVYNAAAKVGGIVATQITLPILHW